MYSVYLAGRIAGLSYEDAQRQRLELTKKLNIIGVDCRNPLRGKSFLSDSQSITINSYIKKLSIQEIIQRDLNDIDKCDVVLVLTGDTPSFGTAGEFYFATWLAKKPTIVISNNNVGGWLEYYATKIVKSEDEAVEVIKDWKYYWNGDGAYNND